MSSFQDGTGDYPVHLPVFELPGAELFDKCTRHSSPQSRFPDTWSCNRNYTFGHHCAGPVKMTYCNDVLIADMPNLFPLVDRVDEVDVGGWQASRMWSAEGVQMQIIFVYF